MIQYLKGVKAKMPIRDTFTMGLLPVPLVVFPGMVTTLTLKPRVYGASVKKAVQHDQSLVFALERHDRQPSGVATTGRILDLDEGADAWQVQVAGIQRAHLLSYYHQGTALMAKLRYAADDEESIPPLLIEEAWALASELWAMVDETGSHACLPQAPALLSYWIAAHVPLNAATQQELLEIATSRARLAKEISLMRTLLDGLRTKHSG